MADKYDEMALKLLPLVIFRTDGGAQRAASVVAQALRDVERETVERMKGEREKPHWRDCLASEVPGASCQFPKCDC